MAGEDDQYEDMTISNSDATGIGSEQERMLESVLSGAHADLPEDLRRVEEVLAAAAGPAQPDDLDGLMAAMAEHARVLGPVPAARRRKRFVAVGIGAAAAVLLGTAGAAHANVLPGPIQDLAHRAFGAPASDERTDSPGRPSVVVPGGSLSPRPGASTDPSRAGSSGQDRAVPPGQVKRTDKAVPPGQVKRTDKAVPPGQVKRTDKAVPPGQVKRTDKAVPPGQVKRTDKAVPPGQVKRSGAATPTAKASNKGNGNRAGRVDLVTNSGAGGRVAR